MKNPDSLKQLTAIVILISLFGCETQTPIDHQQTFRWSNTTRATMLEQYANMRNCCKTAEEITYDKFPSDEQWSFTISNADKAIQFDTGLSPVKAYELPSTKHAYKFSLLSYTLRDKGMHCFADCTYMFIPIILFLDSEYMPLYTFLPGDLRLHDPTKIPNNQHGYSHTVKIDGDNKAKYLVIYTTPSLIKNSAEFSFKNNAAVYSSDGKPITGAPFGQFVISIDKIE